MNTEPEDYWYWLKTSLMLPLPLLKDFDGLGEALMALGRVVCTVIFRAFILITLPISAPVLAWVFLKENKRVMLARKKALQEISNARNKLRSYEGQNCQDREPYKVDQPRPTMPGGDPNDLWKILLFLVIMSLVTVGIVNYN